MLKKRLVLFFLFLCSFAVLSPVFSDLQESVKVSLIEIWVKVTDKANQPVSNLQPNDFKIYIDGKQMASRCFDKTFDTAQPSPSTDAYFVGDPSAPAANGPKAKYI